MKKIIISLLKIAISVAILAYLVRDALNNQAFDQLQQQPKHWGLLAAAWVVCGSAVLLTLLRWYYLVRALQLPFRLRDALRLGFLGYLANFAPLGIVGGDLLKSVMLAREQPGRRTQAVATVVVDRVIGLYMLFVVASAAILATGFWQSRSATVQLICQAALLLTAVGTVGVAMLFVPGMTHGRLSELLGRLPYVGPTLRQLIGAVRMYRQKTHVLIAAALMSIAVHGLFTTGVFLIASGLYQHVPSFGMHFVLSPLSAVTGVLPVNVGPFELVLNILYAHAPTPAGAIIHPGQGFVVALGYRIITVLIAAVGICYYLRSRQEVAEVLQQAEQEPEQQTAGSSRQAVGSR